MRNLVEILSEIRPEFDFKTSEDFIEDGYIDSFDLITLVATIEKEYGIKIKGTEILREAGRRSKLVTSMQIFKK